MYIFLEAVGLPVLLISRGKEPAVLNSSWSYECALVANNCTGLDYRLCPRKLCFFIWRPHANSRSMDETWRLWLWKWGASTGYGGLSSPTCHCQHCGLWKLLHQAPGVQTAPWSQALHVCGLQPMLPTLQALPPRLFWWLCGWFSFLASCCDCRHGKNKRWSPELVSESHVPHQTRRCLGMVLETKGNFSLFFHSQS